MKNCRIHQRLKEDTPSMLHRQAAKAGIEGFEVLPEDELGISKAARRIRIMHRKGQTHGSIGAKVGPSQGRRRIKSPVISTPTEKGSVKHKTDQADKKARGPARR